MPRPEWKNAFSTRNLRSRFVAVHVPAPLPPRYSGNRHLHLLKLHLPYHESDHVLTHAYNLFAGGQDLEDIQNLQHSPAMKNLLGA